MENEEKDINGNPRDLLLGAQRRKSTQVDKFKTKSVCLTDPHRNTAALLLWAKAFFYKLRLVKEFLNADLWFVILAFNSWWHNVTAFKIPHHRRGCIDK